MNVVVTGGAGFIGSHLVDALVARGDDVTVIDNFATGRTQNLDGSASRVRIERVDIRDLPALTRAVEGAEVVWHLAALPSVAASVREPRLSHDVNLTGTLNVLEASRAAGARRVVFASSSAIYGDTPNLPCQEDERPRPLSPYAAAKHAGEMYAHVYSAVYGLETVALRFFNVFGPRQDPSSEYAAVVPKFIESYLRGKPPTVHGDGGQTRDFIFVRRVVDALLLAAEAPATRVNGRAFNVASGVPTRILDLAKKVQGLAGEDHAPHHAPPREGDIRHSVASVAAARDALGFAVPPEALESGLRETIDWFRERGAASSKAP